MIEKTIYAGEAQFAGWTDSHTGGPKITFWLPDADFLDKFRAMTARKGGTAGHRVMLAIVEIGDDEQPVTPEAGTKKTEPLPPGVRNEMLDSPQRVGPYCIEAVELCSNPLFQKWAQYESGVPVRNVEQAKQFMLVILGIRSRKEIDESEEVKEAFIENIRVAFMHWQREQTEGGAT